MKLRNKCISTLFTASFLLCSHINMVYAGQIPTTCPSVASIVAEKLDRVVPWLGDGTDGVADAWFGYKISNYNTDLQWGLIVMGVFADSQQQAREQFTQRLPTLVFEEGPKPNDAQDLWGCLYRGIDHTIAITVTPPLPDAQLPIALKIKFK